MKTLIIGSNGQLGSEISAYFSKSETVVGLTHADIEISDPASVEDRLRQHNPDVGINTAAYHNVPLCESNIDQTMRVNAAGALNLARVCAERKAILVQISTDYVFDGSKGAPYIESDPANPLNVYAVSKLAGEYLVQNYSERFFILRVSGIYGSVACRAKGGNFITTMLRAAKERDVVRVVDDEILTPTPVSDIARNLHDLIHTGAWGLYHMTSEGACSWFEFAQVIFEQLALRTPLEACKVSDFPMTVRRPTYSVLENRNLKSAGINNMQPWRAGLEAFLKANYQ